MIFPGSGLVGFANFDCLSAELALRPCRKEPEQREELRSQTIALS
jgi:hypothetical protein